MEFFKYWFEKKLKWHTQKTSEVTYRPELSDNHQGLNKHNHKYLAKSFCARDTKYSHFSHVRCRLTNAVFKAIL